MRPNGAVASAAGLAPFGHVGWGYRDRAEYIGRATEFIAGCLRHNQRVAYIGEGSSAALRAELPAIPGMAERLDSGGIEVIPSEDFFVFSSASDVIDAERTLAKYVAAVDRAIADGYAGFGAVVDVTPVARTAEQRTAMAALEYLGDQKIAVLPFSALCAYDTGRLGSAASELICLHPFVPKGAPRFRLYAEPDGETTFALTGEIDAAGHELFATTLQRVWPLSKVHTVRIDAHGLEFISHQQLYLLDECARAFDRKVVLQTNQPIPARLLGALNFTNLRVEATPYRTPTDEAAHLRAQLQQREQELESQSVIEQVKGMLMQHLGLDADDAFAVLVSFAQDTNAKVRDVAERIRAELTGTASQKSRLATLNALQAAQDRLRRHS